MLSIRLAERRDVSLIVSLIGELAEYERLADQCVATPEAIERNLFGSRPSAEVLVAHWGDEPAGFALYFQNFSTFLAKPGLYLEDLFVRPNFRGRGVGRAMFARLAAITVSRDYGRFDWAVLDWNSLALGFYDRMGATPQSDWRIFRLAGAALARLADTDVG